MFTMNELFHGGMTGPTRRCGAPRIAMVASSLRRGGAEKQAVYMARALRDAGMGVKVFYLGAGGHYETILGEMDVSHQTIFRPRSPGAMLITLSKALWRWRPDIVMASQFGDLKFAGVAGRLCRALTLGGIRSDGRRDLQANGRWSRFLLRLAHGFIANSHHARQALADQGINASRIHVLPNVIDVEEFDRSSALPSSLSLPSGRTLAVAIGSLQPCKRFDRFLEALAKARESAPSLAGMIAGADLGSRASLQQKAKSLGLTPRDITFAGECDGVPSLLARSAFLVLSSDNEGFPNVILEAMAARLPVVTTPAGDAGRIVRHGRTGYVVAKDDTMGMAEAMVKLARSGSLRTELGEAGRRRVSREYNFECLSARLISILQFFAGTTRRYALMDMLAPGFRSRKSRTGFESLTFDGHAA
jgi:glycosyltransferase involved in cell wall biosynthesis